MPAEQFTPRTISRNQYSVDVAARNNGQPGFAMRISTRVKRSQELGNLINNLRETSLMRGSIELKSTLYFHPNGTVQIGWSQNAQDHVQLEDIMHQMHFAPSPADGIHADARVSVANGQIVCWANNSANAVKAMEFLSSSIPDGDNKACTLLLYDKNMGAKSIGQWKKLQQ